MLHKRIIGWEKLILLENELILVYSIKLDLDCFGEGIKLISQEKCHVI